MIEGVTGKIPLEGLYEAFKPEVIEGMNIFKPKLKGWVFREVQQTDLNRAGKGQKGGLKKPGPQIFEGVEMVRLMLYAQHFHFLVDGNVVLWCKGVK